MSRLPALAVLAGGLVAAGALILAAASGPPYLSTDGVSGWIVLFAAGLFAALLATPFAIDSLVGSVGLLTTVEAGLVVVALLFVLLSG